MPQLTAQLLPVGVARRARVASPPSPAKTPELKPVEPGGIWREIFNIFLPALCLDRNTENLLCRLTVDMHAKSQNFTWRAGLTLQQWTACLSGHQAAESSIFHASRLIVNQYSMAQPGL